MKRLLLTALIGILAFNAANAQTGSQNVFTPISKYLQAGDCEKLSAWFADNLELDILGAVSNCSRNQGKLIMKDFFTDYTPKHFRIIHNGSKPPMNYAVGLLDAGGERFRIIIYVKTTGQYSCIEQLKVEKD